MPDELAISPEELAKVMGIENDVQAAKSPPESPGISKSSEKKSRSGSNVTARPVEFAPLQSSGSDTSSTNLDLLLGITLRVTVELGRTKMNVEEVLKLGPGSVVELDKLAGEPVDVLVNDRLIARGEVVVLDDRFGVRITDVIPPAQRIDSLQ
jgi:flagellar motor switch protein FliN/FliY